MFTGTGIAKTFQDSRLPGIFCATFLLRSTGNAGAFQEKNLAQFSWHRNKKLAFNFANPRKAPGKRKSRKTQYDMISDSFNAC
ncbi:hypothetical protein HNR65_003399 [Desulfosalsimonas propionicica]|uniref:Uncharacterized protein n=1 Tax=Desulfosalsimonas propionicica TaxID=332175 RepID=A0A7W0CC51_9BACT|nr:hypothetical protein [Desulfosalsimonas propionicica]